MKRLLALISLLAITCSAHAATQGDAAPCMACHGTNGAGQAAAGVPRLAGLNVAYLLKQLNDFASGARSNPVMTPIATTLNTDERQALAVYYSKLPPPAALAVPNSASPLPADSIVATTLATRGRWSENIPACEQCHGPRGIGVGTHFPPLAGQPANYLAAQLRAWKQGQRRNDPLGLMQHIAEKLDDADIDAVANWFAVQPTSSKEKTP
jgi:cytochrome c553